MEQKHGGPHPGGQEIHRDRPIPGHTPGGAVLRRAGAPQGTGRSQPEKHRHRWNCGGCAAVPPPAWVEQQALTILNRLIQKPESITPGQIAVDAPAEARTLRRKLDEALHTSPVDGERTRDMRFGWQNTGSTPLGRRNMRRYGSRSSSGTIRSWRRWSRISCVRVSDRSHTEEKAFRSS